MMTLMIPGNHRPSGASWLHKRMARSGLGTVPGVLHLEGHHRQRRKQPRGPVPILSIVQTTPRSRETPTAIRLPSPDGNR
jgi:hypothetical protein